MIILSLFMSYRFSQSLGSLEGETYDSDPDLSSEDSENYDLEVLPL